MSSIYETLRADIIVAMKARDSVTTTALRTADAAIKRAAMDGNKEIDDVLSLATLRKAVKNLTDANLYHATLRAADLTRADLSGAALHFANFNGATLPNGTKYKSK
jgi:uncharacterized protein YjbI with pentapeptide repeats